ncbi:MAG: glycosyltransferase [Candidatus Competibacter sp.]|jgi:GT2 family glycosyltransferase/glycosyltransferase involved in cell wall biosynthesis
MTTHSDSISPVIIASPLLPVIDIIIPVYRGLDETRRCLESVLAFPQRTACEIVVIDDCSPEPGLSAFLRQRAETGAFTLLENPVNTGFVNAVNRGMVLHPDRDVVLLNSDTEVHGDWLDRLYRHAGGDPMIGTVTPFSNNATICSYPRFMQDNPLPAGWSLAAVDALFAEVNAGQAVDMPTAVGFCMYITRRCLDQVGYFDAALFARGYGEENDFSMRALEIGFRHLHAADVFVYHRGGISFGMESATLCAQAQQILEQRQPRYFPLVGDYCARDPARLLRRRIDNARLARSSKPRLLFIMHKGGGGTEKHVWELAALLEPDYEVFILRAFDVTTAVLEWARHGEEFSVWFPMPYAYSDLLSFLRQLSVARIHFHHVLDLQQQLLQLPNDLAVPYDFTLHDYYPICPQYNLARADGRYCGEPDTAGCTACLAERPAPWGLDILSWRTCFEHLLVGAERVIVPSQDLLTRMQRYVPAAPYHYLPHPEPMLDNVTIPPSCDGVGELKVLVLGRLTPAKGLHLLERCADDAKMRELPLFFRVIGHADREARQEPDLPLSFSGPYQDERLLLLIARERPDVIFFPAQWPETYSYTLSVAIRTGLPIVAPRLGAFIERLVNHPQSWLLDWDTPAGIWNDLFMGLRRISESTPC